MSLEELRPILGELLMGFYCDPLPGDCLTYEGHEWQILERCFEPIRYKSKASRIVPLLRVQYLGRVKAEA